MPLSDELERLHTLFQQGVINEAEFLEAKAAVIRNEEHFLSDEIPLSSDLPDDDAYAASPLAADGTTPTADEKTWGVLIHVSQFAGYVLPLGGFVVPLVLWLVKRGDSETIDEHGRVVVNWMLTQLLMLAVAIPLCAVVVGIPLLIAIILCGIVFAIVGSIRASEGIVWRYPFSLDVF